DALTSSRLPAASLVRSILRSDDLPDTARPAVEMTTRSTRIASGVNIRRVRSSIGVPPKRSRLTLRRAASVRVCGSRLARLIGRTQTRGFLTYLFWHGEAPKADGRDPSAGNAASFHKSRISSNDQGRDGEGRAAAFASDELPQLERRPPRVAGAALLPWIRTGRAAVSRHRRGVHDRRSREHAHACARSKGMARDHDGGRS